jgi:uncharacterized protein (TIGR03435 family)
MNSVVRQIAVVALSLLTAGQCMALPKTGATAPPIHISKLLQAPRGARIEWPSLRGKTVILEFWATWCGPCVASIPHLNELSASLDPQKFLFISIDDEDASVVEAFLQKKKMASWVALDANGATFKAFGVDSRPSTIIVDKNGKIASVTTADKVTRETLIALSKRESIVSAPKRIAESTPVVAAQPQAGAVTQGTSEPLFELRVSPSARTDQGFGMSHSTDGLRWGYTGVNARFLLSQAYSIPGRRIRFAGSEPNDRFDFSADRANIDDVTFARMMQEAIPAALRLAVTKTEESGPVLVLRPSANTKDLQLATQSEASYITFKDGKLFIANSSFDQLAAVLEGHLKTTVLNKSGIKGKFDGELNPQSDDARGFSAALAEAFGLDLVSETAEVEMLEVGKSN